MPKPNALVDGIISLSPPLKAAAATPSQEPPRTVTVNFQGGRSGLLDMATPRAAVWEKRLNFLRENNMPVYVEIDPETNVITQLRAPEAAKVLSLTTIAGDNVEVELIPSPALYYLRHANPDFEELRNALQAALDEKKTVLVTWTLYKREIIDVRALPDSFGPDMPPPPPPSDPPVDPPVSPDRARELFDMMNARSCDSCTPIPPCIPFKYPANGCHARAHEMCRLMFEEGEVPEKVFIFGALTVITSNDPDCYVGWWYHVAPTLSVQLDPDDPDSLETWVIDPAMFDEPVTVEVWRDAQNDPDPILDYRDATAFYPDDVGGPYTVEDEDYTRTNIALAARRFDLEEQCTDHGPSPYSCPIDRRCSLITDRSTFGEDEISAMLEAAPAPAVIEAAFYVVADDYSPEENLGVSEDAPLGAPPSIVPSPALPGVTIRATHLALEYPSQPKRRQRLTWTYRVEFANTDDFTEEEREVELTVSIEAVSDTALIRLIRQPNPYEIDGATSWLSTDLRVFQIREGEEKFGVTMGDSPADAPTFIQQVIRNLNGDDAGDQTFEDDISIDQRASWLELSEQVDGTRVFNFAVARVRYRGEALEAENVRVFFRLFPVSSTSLEYDQATTYRRGGIGDVTIPLLGIRGGETVTIPCFAEPRINTAVTNLNDQEDPTNVQTIPPDPDGAEKQVYFGCWLDINQLEGLFPLEPDPPDGEFPADRLSIQELIRGRHQCLIAEIAFDLDPIPPGTTPAQSDKLAQRNLAIVESDNPGHVASHRVPLTFEIRPTGARLQPDELPDELMIDWGDLPAGSVATIYLPGISTAVVLDLAAEMYKVHRLNRIDNHTLLCQAEGITYIPIPPGIGSNFAGLLSVDLPETVREKQVFTVVVRQVTNAEGIGGARRDPIKWRRILGSFQLTIPVYAKEVILEPETRLLSVLRWIQKSIPEDNRWFPVFRRYLKQIAGRVDALGGNSSNVAPSPSGDWKDRKAKLCARLASATAALLGLTVVSLGAFSGGGAGTILIPALVLLIGVAYFWIKKCRPSNCRLLRALVGGLSAGVLILTLLVLIGVSTPQLLTILAISIIIFGIGTLVGLARC